MRKLFYIIIFLLLASTSWSADETFYVRGDGTATAKGDASGCGAANTATNITWAEANVSVGDTVMVCGPTNGGNITANFAPSTTPTQESERITIKNAEVEKPIFYHLTNSFLLAAPYFTIDGLIFQAGEWGRYSIDIFSTSAHHIEIKNCAFYDGNGYGAHIYAGGNYNYIHDNVFNYLFVKVGAQDPQVFIKGDYNRIIDNEFIDGGGHGMLEADGALYSVIRGNTFRTTGTYYYPDVLPHAVPDHMIMWLKNSNYALFEENTFYEEGDAYGDGFGNPIHLHNGDYQIIRRNTFYHTDGTFFDMYTSASDQDAAYINVYNNTGYDMSSMGYVDGVSGGGPITKGVFVFDSSNVSDSYVDYTSVLNNIVSHVGYAYKTCFLSPPETQCVPYIAKHPNSAGYSNNRYGRMEYNIFHDVNNTDDYWWKGTTYSVSDEPLELDYQTDIANNITSEPTFTDAATGDFTADDGDAPQVDAGAWLTTINQASGSAQTITLDDYPYMFYDGWGISGETGDTIKTQNGQTGVIQSINYGAKTITLTAAIDIQDNEGIALDYVGNAPDIGAEEFSSPAPGNGIENPTPADEATGIDLDTDISWTNGDDVTKTDIYFDDTDCTTEVGADEDAETSYDPGTLNHNDTYYWKVITEPDGANISFPSTGCYTFTTIGTPSDVVGLSQNSGGPAFIQNSGGLNWVLSQ